MGKASRRARHQTRRHDRHDDVEGGTDVFLSSTKMSAMIYKLIEPCRHAMISAGLYRGDASFKILVETGILAWNIALLPEAKWDNEINAVFLHTIGGLHLSLLRRILARSVRWLRLPFFGLVAGEGSRLFKVAMHELIARKLREFPDVRRLIADYEVSRTPAGELMLIVGAMPL